MKLSRQSEFSLKISSLGKQKTEKVGGRGAKGQAHNFWLCQKTNKYEETSGSGNLGGNVTYDLVQATSKRLYQLLILLRCRLTQELCLMGQPGFLRGRLIQPFLCFCMHYLEMYCCRQACWSSLQKERKAQ